MRAFRGLTVTGSPVQIDRFISKLLEDVGQDWKHDPASEARLALPVSGKMYCFVCSEREDRPRAALWLHRDSPTNLTVTNIIPIPKGSLSRAEYNAIVAEFYRRFVTPATQEIGVQATLTDENRTIADWLTPRTAELLLRFSRLANRSTGTTHPLDEHRWFEFIWASHEEQARLPMEILAQWLEEDEGWPEDQALKVAAEYEKERALLAFPAQAA
jgi:hypothetical protein